MSIIGDHLTEDNSGMHEPPKVKTVSRIFIDVKGGCVQSIYGEPVPDDVSLEFIIRDHDNIDAGDPDPLDDHPDDIKLTYYL